MLESKRREGLACAVTLREGRSAAARLRGWLCTVCGDTNRRVLKPALGLRARRNQKRSHYSKQRVRYLVAGGASPERA